MQKKDKKKKSPTAAPGDDEFLQADATKEDLKKGNYTKIITLSYDEVDPS